jgi:hypothetical protein
MLNIEGFMGIICWLFGHRTNGHRYNGAEYMEVNNHGADGIGRKHASVYCNCARCGKKFRVGMIHAHTDRPITGAIVEKAALAITSKLHLLDLSDDQAKRLKAAAVTVLEIGRDEL